MQTEQPPMYIPTSDYESLGNKQYRYDNTQAFYKYIDDNKMRKKNKKLQLQQQEQQKAEEIDKQKRLAEINQPSYDGEITGSEYLNSLQGDKELWRGIGEYVQANHSYPSYRKLRLEETDEYKVEELKKKIADTTDFTVILNQEQFDNYVKEEDHSKWKAKSYGMGGYNLAYIYKRKTDEDFENDKTVEIRLKLNKELEEFMKTNAKEISVEFDTEPPKLTVQNNDRQFYLFDNQALFDEYNKKKGQIPGGKSKKKRSYIKKKASRRYGVKSNKSHKRK